MFCSKCGNEIPSQSKFCSKCGQSVVPTPNETVVSNNTVGYTLTINRAKQWFAINPAVKIVVDGNTEYKIDNGATLNIPIAAGTHNIAFSCSIFVCACIQNQQEIWICCDVVCNVFV